jgi:hypothetical protein
MTSGGNIRITPAVHPEHNGNKTYRIPVQLDGGAAVTLCSPALTKSVYTWIFDHDTGFDLTCVVGKHWIQLVLSTI